MTINNAINATQNGIQTLNNSTGAWTGSTVTQHGVLVGGASNAIGSTAVGATGVILQGVTGADPTYSTATYPSTAGSSGKILISDGTNIVSSTPTYPNAAGTSGKVLISDGTNIVSSTPTYPNAAGTSGNIITSNGTNFISSAPSGLGGLVFIQQQTASTSASISFTTGIGSTYVDYLLVCSHAVADNNSTGFHMVVSTNGGSSYASTGYTGGTMAFTSGNGVSIATSTSFWVLSNSVGSSGYFSGNVWMHNLNNGTAPTLSGTTQSLRGDALIGANILCAQTSNTTVNAIRVLMDSGNIVSGVFTLYGLAKA